MIENYAMVEIIAYMYKNADTTKFHSYTFAGDNFVYHDSRLLSTTFINRITQKATVYNKF